MDLKSRLAFVAQGWVDRWNESDVGPVSLARLARGAIGDEKYFLRLDSMRRGPTTETLENFARYLSDPANWPGGVVSDEARTFAHFVLGSAPIAQVSPDDAAADIGSGKSFRSEAPADPAAVPTGQAEPAAPPPVAGASGRTPGAEEGANAPASAPVPGDLLVEVERGAF